MREWRARGENAFPGKGNRQRGEVADDAQRVAELERKIGQMTMENDFLKALLHFREHHPPDVVSGAAVCTGKSRKRPKREEP